MVEVEVGTRSPKAPLGASGRPSWLPLALWIATLQLVSGVIARVSMPELDGWYQDLQRSPLNPPGWSFGVAWTALYVLIAVVGWRIWVRRGQPGVVTTLRLYVTQLLLNWGWSGVFFTAQLVWTAFIWLLAMVAIVATITIRLRSADRPSAVMFAPYLAWLAFASYLNGYIAFHN